MIVVDTNVVSELMRPSPTAAVVAWVRGNERELYTTSITLAEIAYGIERLPGGPRKRLLRSAAEEVFAAFEERILSFDAKAALAYATVVSGRDRAGRPIDGFDAQIAAICRVLQAALATRNLKDFRDTGIDVIDPWRPDPHCSVSGKRQEPYRLVPHESSLRPGLGDSGLKKPAGELENEPTIDEAPPSS
ncbi:MAG TPA: type II toxin-antitoxin system VapC family toxin [Actinomycetota bacterium]